MRNVQKKFVEKIKTHVLSPFLIENRSCNEITWKNVAEPCWLQMTIWRIRIVCWIPKSTNKFGSCNNYCFCTAKIFARTRLTVCHTHITCLVIYLLLSVGSFHKHAGWINYHTTHEYVVCRNSLGSRWRWGE